MPDVTIMYNSTNEPCLKYCLGLIGDRGIAPHDRTSARLQHQVLYLESATERLEVSATSTDTRSTYRLAKVKSEVFLKAATFSSLALPVPLREDEIKVVADDLDWNDIEWCLDSFVVRGQRYNVQTMWLRDIKEGASTNA